MFIENARRLVHYNISAFSLQVRPPSFSAAPLLAPSQRGLSACRLGECPAVRGDTLSTAARSPSPIGGGKECAAVQAKLKFGNIHKSGGNVLASLHTFLIKSLLIFNFFSFIMYIEKMRNRFRRITPIPLSFSYLSFLFGKGPELTGHQHRVFSAFRGVWNRFCRKPSLFFLQNCRFWSIV